jgi:ABC-type dipeptide/oligopeptide/nickel transport system permease subunit
LPAALPLFIGLIVVGFRVMRRAPSLGAFLVVVASAAFAALIFWAIVPPLVAIALSVCAIRRARRLQQRG